MGEIADEMLARYGYFDDEGEGSGPPTCNRCGKTDLEWVDVGGRPTRWRLYDGKKLHTCSNKDFCKDDFEVVK